MDNHNTSPVRLTIHHLKHMTGLALIYVLVLSSLNILPRLSHFIRGADQRPIIWLMLASSGVGIFMTIIVLPFLNAGFYCRILCRILNEQDSLSFFKRAMSHFKLFFLIALFFFGLSFLFQVIPTAIVPVLAHTKTDHLLMFKIINYTTRFIDFIIAALFLFAYPLATLGYLSH